MTPGVGTYPATKFALEGLTEAPAGEGAAFGIKALIVEPGAFRTGFAGGGALQRSAALLPAYEGTVGTVRTGLPGSDGKQTGYPVKAAAAILAHADTARAEARTWEAVSRGTDFDA
ncbi:hypothetical protein ACFY7H_11340 [Streptomyces sp. NPDC012794]|uniref:hypothetical protein n=1 Tax=Streptomyces sp. NPDC012794 TaxID=3364850 RepID=UPI00369FABFF